MSKENYTKDFKKIGIHLNLHKQECFDDEIYEVVFRDEKELVITSNGTYELKGSYRGEHTQLDISKFNKNLCIVGNNIVYGGANGDIFLIRMYLQRNHHIFSQKEILEGLFAVIDQIINLTDNSIVVLGIDKENKTKTVLLNINGDSMKVVMPRIHENVFIKYIIPSDETDFSLIVGRSNRNTRLFQFNAETYDKKVSIDLQENLEDKNPKMCIAFGNIIIAYGNTILSCTSEKVEYKQVIPTLHENELICDMIQVEEYLIVFYKSTCFYLLNSELDIVGEMENLTENETLEKCYLLSNGKLCLVFSNEFQHSLRFFSYETYENVAPAVKSIKLSKTAKNIIKVFGDLEKCELTTPEEKQFSSSKFEEIYKRPEPTNEDLAIIGMEKYVKSFGTELILCQSTDLNNYTNKVHANLLFNGFLDTNPCYYCMAVELNDLNFINTEMTDDKNAELNEKFTNFLATYTNIASDEIIVTKIHRKSVSFDFTFSEVNYNALFHAKIPALKQLIGKECDKFLVGKTEIKQVEVISKHPKLQTIYNEAIVNHDQLLSNSTDETVENMNQLVVAIDGLLDQYFNFYRIEFEIEDLDFLDKKDFEEMNNKICENFKSFISSFSNISSDKINIIKVHNQNVSFNFTFVNSDHHKLFTNKMNELNKRKDQQLDNMVWQQTKIKNLEMHPTLKECKLNINMFNPEFDKTFDMPFTDIRGQLPYNHPLGWTRVALNIKYFGFSDDDDWIQKDKRRGEWAIAYHGIKEDPLGTAEKIINDESGKPTLKAGYRNLFCNAPNINDLDVEGYGKPCGVGIYCAPEITTAEMFAGEFVANNGKTTRLALMCRVNPYKVKIVETPYEGNFRYYIVNESDNIRPYGILLQN